MSNFWYAKLVVDLFTIKLGFSWSAERWSYSGPRWVQYVQKLPIVPIIIELGYNMGFSLLLWNTLPNSSSIKVVHHFNEFLSCHNDLTGLLPCRPPFIHTCQFVIRLYVIVGYIDLKQYLYTIYSVSILCAVLGWYCSQWALAFNI